MFYLVLGCLFMLILLYQILQKIYTELKRIAYQLETNQLVNLHDRLNDTEDQEIQNSASDI